MAIHSTLHKRKLHCSSYKLSRQTGFTLVELMVALVLGLLLIGGVISVYISTQQNFKTTENLSRLQEGARFAFEQMGREIREAGATPCGVKAVASVIRTGTSTTPPWWADWDNGTLVGFKGGSTTVAAGVNFGTSTNDRVSSTDAILVMRLNMDDGDLRVIRSHDPVGKSIVVDSVARYASEDVVLACDNSSGAIFEIASTSNGATTKTMDYDSSASDGNCTDKLGWPQPSNCSGSTTKTISSGGFVAKYDPAFWYIGIGSNGTSRSLYRTALVMKNTASGKIPTAEPREMVTDVNDLKVEFLTRDKSTTPETLASDWVEADSAVFAATGGWGDKNTKEAVAVRLTLTFRSPDAVGTDGQPLERKTISVISLRNREVKS
jgi:type IV pilus assembly protein PilW